MIKDYMRWVIGVIESEKPEIALHTLKHENIQGSGQFFMPHLAMAEDNECLVFIRRLAQFYNPDHPAVDYIAKAYEDFTKQMKLAPQDQDFYPLDILIALGFEGKTLLSATIRTHEQFAQYGDEYRYGLHEDLAEYIHAGQPSKAQIKQIIENFHNHYTMFRDRIIDDPKLFEHLTAIGVDVHGITSPRIKKSQFQDLYDMQSKQSPVATTESKAPDLNESRGNIINLLTGRSMDGSLEVTIRPARAAPTRAPYIIQDDSHDPLSDIHNGRILQQGLADKLASFSARQKFEKVATDAGAVFDSARRHMIFSGPPGTGKTTLAEDIGSFFFDLGILRRGHVHHTTGAKLLAEYVAQTAPRVRKAAQLALGGILFIDEIYQWYDEPRYGQEAVNELLEQMETHRDDLIVIVAGYKDRVMDVLNMNAGLISRFNTEFAFDHFSRDELSQILHLNLNKMNMKLTPDAHEEFVNILEQQKASMGDEFANARQLEVFLDHAVTAHSVRWLEQTKSRSALSEAFTVGNDNVDVLTMTAEDVRAATKLGVTKAEKRRSIGFHANPS